MIYCNTQQRQIWSAQACLRFVLSACRQNSKPGLPGLINDDYPGTYTERDSAALQHKNYIILEGKSTEGRLILQDLIMLIIKPVIFSFFGVYPLRKQIASNLFQFF